MTVDALRQRSQDIWIWSLIDEESGSGQSIRYRGSITSLASHNIVTLHACPKEADCTICPPGVPSRPPPLNLEVPEYDFPDDDTLVVG